jgi:integrase
MALGKITKTTVEQLQPGDWLWDADHREVVKGFGARRQIDGIFYYIRFRLNGRQHIKSLGRHGSPFTPDTARSKAKAALGKVAAGTDPFAEEAKVRAAETLGGELARYLARKRAAMKPRAFAEVERHLMHHAKPLHRMRLGEIDRRTVALRLAEIEEASGPVARNRVRSSLSALFNWAITEGLIETNPVTGTAKAEEGGSLERVLSLAELAEVWAALGEEDQFGDIVKLLMLTGQRREEIGALRWNEVDFARGLIVLPPSRTKNKRLHEIPLSTVAREILQRQPRNVPFVFGRGSGGFSAWSDCKAALDQRLLLARREVKPRAKPLADWRLHDLRRTVATGMAELGVLPHIIEAILNHVGGHKGGVAGIYNRAKYEGEMRKALQLWADVEVITSQ